MSAPLPAWWDLYCDRVVDLAKKLDQSLERLIELIHKHWKPEIAQYCEKRMRERWLM